MPWAQLFTRWHAIITSQQQSGSSAERPISNLWVGRRYFDTTLGMPIWVSQVNPTVIWTGATGSAYLELSSSTTQNVVSITGAQAVTYNSAEISAGFDLILGTRITPRKPGIYSIAFNAQVYVSVGSASLDFWLAKNGVNMPNTLIRVTLSGPTDNLIAPQPYLVNAATGDYFEVMMNGTSTNAGILAIPAAVTPTRPAGPSIIVTANLESAV